MHTSNKCIPINVNLLILLIILLFHMNGARSASGKNKPLRHSFLSGAAHVLKSGFSAVKIELCRRYGNISGTIKNGYFRLVNAICPGKGKSFCCVVYAFIISAFAHPVKKGEPLL